MDLATYQQRLQGIPAPTHEQAVAFAEFVAEAHSWYKHLPQAPPGAVCFAFLNPDAGCDLLRGEDGRWQARIRAGERGFHYSWLPTAEYRRRFGHLDYLCHAGTTFVLGDGQVVNPGGAGPWVVGPDGSQEPIPAAIAALGAVEWTGMVHPRSAWPGLYRRYPDLLVDVWPEQIGGQALRAKVMQRMADLARDYSLHQPLPDDSTLDQQLFDLLGPERCRQRQSLVEAIARIRRQLFGE